MAKKFENIDEEEVLVLDTDLAGKLGNKEIDGSETIKVNITKGLSIEQVEERLLSGQVNKTENKNFKSKREIIFSNIFTLFNVLNLAIAAALIAAGSYKNLLFLPIIIANTVIGILQELRARKVISELSFVETPLVSVVRNGEQIKIKQDEVVVDDIIYYEAGNQIVADSVVRKGVIEVNESLLTGEAENIVKKPGSLLYSGAFVTSGDCYAKVERVGKDNYIQQLTNNARKYTKPRREILSALNTLITILSITVVVLGTALFTNQFLVVTGHNWRSSITYTAGAMIGMIPSGLYLMSSVSLAAGAIKLAKHNTLCQELHCIEMLARVDTLCLDKTGTLTDGSMKVDEVIDINPETVPTKDIISNILGNVRGNNATFYALDDKFGHTRHSISKQIIPFSSTRKYMGYYDNKENKTYLLGAPEFVCKKDFKGSTLEQLVDKYAGEGLRVLLLGVSKENFDSEDYEFTKTTPVALVTLEDVIRESAVDTINYFKSSNVDIKVISGDNPITVSKIASRVGINKAEKYISLNNMSNDEVKNAVSKYNVFGRVNPKQKQLIIKELKRLGKTVAMTGDGVNDILALKESDCSIAMANGSEAARNIAHLVLLNSDFSSMPTVIQEGRRVINNIKRVACLYLTKTLFSILMTIVCLLTKNIYPIQTVQLTLLDWFITTIPAFIIALEPNNNQIKGKFLKDVLLNALPGAVLIVFNFLVILLVSNEYLHLNAQQISSLTVLQLCAVDFMVLNKACKPYNGRRGALIIIMLVLFLIGYIILGNLFEIQQLSTLGITNTLLLFVIILYSTYLYNYIFKFAEYIKSKKWLTLFK